MSRLYRNIIQASLEALDSVFRQQEQADKVVAKTLKKDKRWGARDRRFIAETTYDIVRWYRYLYEHIVHFVKKVVLLIQYRCYLIDLF